jgi:hypothetical protein
MGVQTNSGSYVKHVGETASRSRARRQFFVSLALANLSSRLCW